MSINRSSLALAGPCLLVFLLLAGAACTQSPEVRKQRALQRGEQYLREGKANEAIVELRNALQVDPDFVPALHALGRAYATKSWYGDALRELVRAQGVAPDSLPVAADLGRALVEVGAWKDAREQAAKILEKEPRNPDGLYIRAAALMQEGKAKDALVLLEGLGPGEGPQELPRLRGAALMILGKTAEAEQAFRVALEKNPNDARSMAALGEIRLLGQKYEDAVKLFEQAKAIKSDDANIRLGLAATKARLNRVPEAIKELEELDPRARSVAVLLALGRFYVQAERSTDAVRLLSSVVERVPRFPQARLLLGAAYLAADNPRSARGEFEELNRQVPDHPLVRFALAITLTRTGQPNEALRLLDSVAKQYEKAAAYQVERARALLFMGRRDEAFTAAETGRRLAPEAPQAYIVLGEIQTQRGNSKAAQEMFAKAAEVDATYVPAHLALGALRVGEKDVAGALKEFDTAVQADPKSLPATRAKVGALIVQKKLREAVQAVETAVKADPDNPGFHTLLAGVYALDGRADKAAAEYKRALELDPRAVGPRVGLARLALSQNQEEEAVTQLQAAVKERPAEPTAVLLLASLYDRLTRYDQAVAVLEAATRADAQSLGFPLTLGGFYLRKGRYDEAIALMSPLLSRMSELTAARSIRGHAYLTKGDGDAAIKDLREVVRVNPKSPAARYDLAAAYAVLGRTEDAKREYKEAIALDPKFEPAKAELAILSGQKPDPSGQRAQADRLREVIKADSKNLVAREALARTLLQLGQVQEAQAELKQLLSIASGYPEANYLMAQVLTQQGKPDEASEYLRAVLRANPSHVGANVMLAGLLLRKGQRERAVSHLETALRVNPNLSGVKFQLGTFYAQTARLPEALRLARELEKSDPTAPGPPALIGLVQLAQRNPQGAIESFQAALKIKPDLVEAQRGLGQAYQMLGQMDRAAESYRRVLAAKGDDVPSLNNLALILLEVRNRPDEALPLAMKAEQLAPRSPEVLDTLGWVHYQRGAYGEAQKFLSRAVELGAGNAAIQYHLGMTYAKLGRKSDAVWALRRAAALDAKLAQSEKIPEFLKDLGE
jgi:tetratricopeptide (TPR) repeat protein